MRTATARDSYANERTQNAAPVRVVKAKRGARARSRYVRAVTVYTVALALLMAGTVFSRMKLSETKANINKYSAALTELESENAYLSYQLESLVSLKNAEEYAVGTLGLVKLDSSRIEYVNLQDENVIEGGENDAPLSETVRAWADSVIELLDG